MGTTDEQAIAPAQQVLEFTDELPAGESHGQTVLVSTGQHIEELAAARSASSLDVPALLIARTCAHTASLLASAADERDREFLTGERTGEGFYPVRPSLYASVRRALAYAPYADLLGLDTPAPDLAAARAFATIIHSQHPGKPLAYRCLLPSHWRANPDDVSAVRFRQELAALGYRYCSDLPAAVSAPEVMALAG